MSIKSSNSPNAGDMVELSEVQFTPTEISICSICKHEILESEYGQVLCCENDDRKCQTEIHLWCLTPKLVDVPEGKWICPACCPLGNTKYLRDSIDTHYSDDSRMKINSRSDYVKWYKNKLRDVQPCRKFTFLQFI